MESYREMLKARLSRLVDMRHNLEHDLNERGVWLLDHCIKSTAADLDVLPKVKS